MQSIIQIIDLDGVNLENSIQDGKFTHDIYCVYVVWRSKKGKLKSLGFQGHEACDSAEKYRAILRQRGIADVKLLVDKTQDVESGITVRKGWDADD